MDRIARYRDTDDLKVCFAFLLSMCGAPFVYYGDEIGMNYVEGLTSVEGGFGRTGSRTPMQWDKTLNAGFSACQKTLIPLDPSPDRPDVLSSLSDKDSLLNTVSELIALRQALYRISADLNLYTPKKINTRLSTAATTIMKRSSQ